MAIGIVAAAFLLARVIGAELRRLRGRSRANAPLIFIVERLAGYTVVLASLFVGLSTLGVDLTSDLTTAFAARWPRSVRGLRGCARMMA